MSEDKSNTPEVAEVVGCTIICVVGIVAFVAMIWICAWGVK